MRILINLILSGIAVLVTAYVLPGVHVHSFLTAIGVAILLSIVNTVIKPVLFLLTLPITLLTLGLFTFVINGLLVLLVSVIVPGFQVDNILWAILFSLVLSLVNAVISTFKQ